MIELGEATKIALLPSKIRWIDEEKGVFTVILRNDVAEIEAFQQHTRQSSFEGIEPRNRVLVIDGAVCHTNLSISGSNKT